MKLPSFLPPSQTDALMKPFHLSMKMQSISTWTHSDKEAFLYDNLCLSSTLPTYHNVCKEGYAYLVQNIFYSFAEPSYNSIPWIGNVEECIKGIPPHAYKHEIDFSWSCPGMYSFLIKSKIFDTK